MFSNETKNRIALITELALDASKDGEGYVLVRSSLINEHVIIWAKESGIELSEEGEDFFRLSWENFNKPHKPCDGCTGDGGCKKNR